MAKAIKAGDKQAVCRKLMTVFKKQYKGTVRKCDRPVLETMLFAACLENADWSDAEAGYKSLVSSFYDLNEIRVSSITELEAAFGPLAQREWRAMWVRSILQHVFEANYEYQFEKIKRKTLDLAARQLGRISNLTVFAQRFTLQQTMAAHVVPMDDAMTRAGIWLGFVPPGSNTEAASDAMKPALRKADVGPFSFWLRRFATDPKLVVAFEEAAGADEETATDYDLLTSPDRVVALIKSPPKPKRKAAPKKARRKAKGRKAAAKKKKVAKKKKPTGKAATTKKTPKRKKAAVRKKSVRKKVVKKKVAKKKKTTSRKTAARKKTGKKTARKKKR